MPLRTFTNSTTTIATRENTMSGAGGQYEIEVEHGLSPVSKRRIHPKLSKRTSFDPCGISSTALVPGSVTHRVVEAALFTRQAAVSAPSWRDCFWVVLQVAARADGRRERCTRHRSDSASRCGVAVLESNDLLGVGSYMGRCNSYMDIKIVPLFDDDEVTEVSRHIVADST